MTNTTPVTIDQQLKAVAREIAMRRNVYRRRVSQGAMKPEEADREIAAMEAVHLSLRLLENVDVYRGTEALLDEAIAAMKALHESAEPIEDDPEIPARIPADALRAFIDAHARLLYEQAHLPVASSAVRDVLTERLRQVSEEGWTAAHDDNHRDGSLAKAAACYALCAGIGTASASGLETHYEFVAEYQRCEVPLPPWPWEPKSWKPKNPRRDLVRAGALILAEIERIDRATVKGNS